MNRRRYLAALATTGVAGCLRLEDSPPTDGTERPSGEGTRRVTASTERTATDTATETTTREPVEPPDAVAVESIENAWTNTDLDGGDTSPRVAVSGETLYAFDGAVSAIDPATGGTTNGVSLDADAWATTATEDALYVGTRADQPQVHRVTPDGNSIEWSVDVPGGVTMVEDILVRSGEVFVGSSEVTTTNAAALHAFDDRNGELRFAYSWDPTTTISNFAFHEDVLYVGIANANAAYDADDRRVFDPRERWGFRMDEPVAVHDDVLYAAGRNLTAMDLSTKSFMFRHPFGNRQLLEPAVASGRVVAGGQDGVHCLDAYSGERYWETDELGRVTAGPVLWNDAAFVVTGGGRLVALQLLDGTITGEVDVPEGASVELVRAGEQLVVVTMQSVSSWTVNWA
ncbi:outer membrane protein assembly factor BamB family protein [Halorubellus salinus]|uniref:outer membrane protein assembly factor BamB family protein n=1 Tax=Halorubellus salinus TaxID=755309 RepID=UPI001D094EDB|nr:PQQ-binding-like beta-propeller repeat protein [Halorubellus salinus]